MRIVTLLFMAGLVLNGCGVKPSTVEPPPGASQEPFPKTYPRPDNAQ